MQRVFRRKISTGLIQDPWKELSNPPTWLQGTTWLAHKQERMKGHLESTRAAVTITKNIPDFKPAAFKEEAQEIFRKACDSFVLQDSNTLFDLLTEPYYDIIRKGLKSRKGGGRFAMKLYEFNTPPEIKQMRVFNSPEKPLNVFAQVTVRISSLRIPVIIEDKIEMKCPPETTITELRKLPIYKTEINPFGGEWLEQEMDGEKRYVHTSSREITKTPPVLFDDENNTLPISTIAAGLGGAKNDMVMAMIHENFVVFEHPLFPAAPGWRIAKA